MFYIHSTDLSISLIRKLDSFLLSSADKVTKGTYNFVSLILKIILLGFPLVLSLTFTPKTQCFVHLSFYSTLQLFNGISSDLQNLLRYFNGTAIVASSRIPFADAVFPINLVLYLKDLKALLFAIPLSKLSALFFEYNRKLPVVLEQFDKLYIGVTKSKPSASSIFVPSTFLIHLVNGTQFMNAVRAATFPSVVKLALT